MSPKTPGAESLEMGTDRNMIGDEDAYLCGARMSKMGTDRNSAFCLITVALGAEV